MDATTLKPIPAGEPVKVPKLGMTIMISRNYDRR